MASPDARSVDIPIQVLGGRVTQFDPQTLPQGASPFNQDVIFSGANAGGEISVGGVGTRPGMASLYAPFAGNPSINYLRTFVDSSGNPHQLILDSLGVLRDDFPEGTFTAIGQVVAGAFAQSDTYAGREWLAIGDGQFGIDIPRQYDGTNFDRVSQAGPGQGPAISDENVVQTVQASPNGATNFSAVIAPGPNGLTQVGFLVTLKTNLLTGFLANLRVGDPIQVTGAGVAGYNGNWTVVSNDLAQTIQYVANVSGLAASGGGLLNMPLVEYSWASGASTVPYTDGQLLNVTGMGVAGYNTTGQQVRTSAIPGTVGYGGYKIGDADVVAFAGAGIFGLGNSGNGSVTNAGNISAGFRLASVCFQFRDGTISAPSIPTSWTAGGGKRAVAATILTGPPNTVARILIFTPVITPPAVAGPFFYFPTSVQTPSAGTFPTMVIPDNVTTSYTVDFLDSVLQSATAASNLFNLLELGECSATLSYSERTFWIGERNKVNAAGGGGGFNNLTFDGGWVQNRTIPAGWKRDAVHGAGGSSAVDGGFGPYWGDAYVIISNAGGSNWGMITQAAAVDYLGVPILQPNTSYSVRARIKRSAGTLAGALTINLQSTIGGFTTTGLVVTAVAATTNYVEYSAVILTPQAVIPPDLTLQLFATPAPAGFAFIIDCVEVFPTNAVDNRTLVRSSYAFEPAFFDGVTGFLIVGKDNGQAVRSMFRLLDKKLYMVKERSFYSTQDDGANEPSLWDVQRISETVGTPSVNGVAVAGEAWAVIAAHDGLYIFWGAQPVKISQEIQPDWDTINWAAGSTIWVVIDQQNKRIHVGVPTGVSTVPNAEFVMDYSQLADAEDIAANPQAHYAYFNPSNVVAPGRARKWTVWNFSSNCAAVTLRADGSYHLLRGNAAGNGKIYDQVATQTSDDGAAIDSLYQTYYFPNGEQEEMLQQIIGGHRRLFKFLTGYVFGSGVMTWSAHGQQDNRIVALSNLTLSNPAKWDFEKNVNFPSERASLIFGTNAVGAWFHVSKIKPTITKDTMLVRGVA